MADLKLHDSLHYGMAQCDHDSTKVIKHQKTLAVSHILQTDLLLEKKKKN